jgi:hypothetical protein
MIVLLYNIWSYGGPGSRKGHNEWYGREDMIRT